MFMKFIKIYKLNLCLLNSENVLGFDEMDVVVIYKN